MILTGHRRDEPDDRDIPFRDSEIVAGVNLGGDGDIDKRNYLGEVRNQLANNCCAHGASASAAATALASGHPIMSPSRNFLYAVARLLGEPPVLGQPRLIDHGCGLRFMFRGMSKEGWGLIPEAYWPETIETVNRVPPDDLFRAGEGATIGAYYRIPDGSGAADQIRAALKLGHFPVFAMTVDDKWAQIERGVWDSPGGKSIGGHAMLFCAYSKQLDAFLVMNSWGLDFGDAGFAWLSARAAERYIFDCWVVQVTPEKIG